MNLRPIWQVTVLNFQMKFTSTELYKNVKLQMKGCSFFIVLLAIILNGCKSFKEQDDELKDTPDRGKIYVSADESFKPIIDQQVIVYESNHPGTKIIVQYKEEQEALKDMATDSIRMIIATRRHTLAEEEFMQDSMKVSARSIRVARDAVAVIVHPEAPDSLFTMQQIRDILTGRSTKKLNPVFDGVKATSTVRFVVDSILHGDSLSPDVRAARSSEGVIDYVSTHKDAIGFIGVSWVANKDDSLQISFLKKVKIARLESKDLPGRYILPVQANIFLNRYPMVRDLVYILKENYKGLGRGFGEFMRGDIGQRIFNRAYLMPTEKSFVLRPVRLNE
jgi:phosphate transport system substrate-binding protein